MSNKDIYIVLSRTGTSFSNIIALFTQKEYSHVSLSLDDSFTKMFSFGRLIPTKVLPAGLVEENLYDGVFALYPQSKCLVYKVPITEEQYDNIHNDIKEFFQEQYKYKYSILGAVTSFFNKSYKRDYYYFCSQFVAEILIKNKVFETNKPPELIKPMDLLNIKNKTLVYEGLINKENYSMVQCSLLSYPKQTITSVISWLIQ